MRSVVAPMLAAIPTVGRERARHSCAGIRYANATNAMRAGGACVQPQWWITGSRTVET